MTITVFIVDGMPYYHTFWFLPYCPPQLCLLPNAPIPPIMLCLIEGFFQPASGHPFADNSTDTTTTSPRKSKTYLSIYDSCAGLGPISSGIFVECELRLFPANHAIDGKIIHTHSRFSVITAADDEDDPRLEIEVHCFVVMNMMDPSSEDTLDNLCTSVTLSG